MPTTSEQNTLDKLSQAPYYSVRITPARTVEVLPHDVAQRALNEAAVRLRGWDFPHYDPSTVVNTPSYVGNTVDWQRHVELWRLYRSRQFIYLGSIWDVAMDLQPRLLAEFERDVFLPQESVKSTVKGALSFIGAIYAVTEFYLFASRLAATLEYSGSVRLDIALRNVENWVLVAGDPAVPWHSFYRSQVDDIRLPAPPVNALGSDDDDAAASARIALIEMFACFNWSNSEGAIEAWQAKFLSGRFY